MALNFLRKLMLVPLASPAWEESPAAEMYAVLWSYYNSNSLYDNIQRFVDNIGLPQAKMLPLRNPANRTIEFYVSKIWPKEIVVESDNDSIKKIITDQIWPWSNWDTNKWFAARQFSTLGDLFIRVVSTPEQPGFLGRPTKPARVYFETMKSEWVTDFELSSRGFLDTIRIDIPIPDENGTGNQWYTEYWSKDFAWFWYSHNKGPQEPISKLGPPSRVINLFEELGIDFIPIVYAGFKDVGGKRGQGAFVHAIDKIDEANRIATRLHSLMYRYNAPMWVASAGGNDTSGRPLPAPRLGTDGSDSLTMGDDSIIRMPGNGQMRALVAGVDWNSHLSLLESHMEEITHDLPELAYYQIRKMTQISGRAVQYLLSDAIDRAVQARSQVLTAMVRADKMALTLGNIVGAFEAQGSFDDDSWNHQFAKEDIFPVSAMEEAEAESMDATAKATRKDLGVSTTQTLRELGYEEDVIAEMKKENEEAAAEALKTAQALAPPASARTAPPPRPNPLNRE